jgi:hypothetical protein
VILCETTNISFSKLDIAEGESFNVCVKSDDGESVRDCTRGFNGPEDEPEEVTIEVS